MVCNQFNILDSILNHIIILLGTLQYNVFKLNKIELHRLKFFKLYDSKKTLSYKYSINDDDSIMSKYWNEYQHMYVLIFFSNIKDEIHEKNWRIEPKTSIWLVLSYRELWQHRFSISVTTYKWNIGIPNII